MSPTTAQLPLTEAAWRYATYQVMPWRVSWQRGETTWRCWSCHQTIRESYPDNGPGAQRGHAPGCTRPKRGRGRR